MLILCSHCQRQYDVSGLAVGEKIRCQCSELVEVPKIQVREARTLHCAGCGGKLESKATHCGYCGGDITTDERNLGDACPACFARLNSGAKFCRECGISIRPEKIKATPISSSCPRCDGQLVLCKVDEGSEYTECSACGGMWLDVNTFEGIVEKRDESAFGKWTAKKTIEQEAQLEVNTVKYLPCPVCSELMNRKNFAGCSGVIIDWCKDHGFWFDTHELEKIAEFVRGGGMDRARVQNLNRQKNELERTRKARNAMAKGNYQANPHRGYNSHDVHGNGVFDVIDVLSSTVMRWLKM